MQDIPQETHHETTRLTQSAQVVLWEIDLTEVGGERYFFCNEQNEKGEPVTWQGRQYQAYPIQGTGFELNGKGSAARPTLTVSNLHGMVATATRLWRGGLACSLTRPNPWPLMSLMKAPAVVTGALTVSSWVSVINSD